MSRSSRRSSNAVSLFPFLAVLMCTMGALIFLLVVTSRQLREKAVERASRSDVPVTIADDPSVILGVSQAAPFSEPEEPAPAAPVPVDPNIALREDVDRLARILAERRRERDEQARVVAAAQQRVYGIEGQRENLERNLAGVRREHAQLQQTERDLKQRQTALAGQIAKVQGEIQLASQERSAAPSQFAIVPYDGKTGTRRRPILIEFSGEGIRFVPEGVLLTKEDLAGFTLDFNPLLAGTQALVDYWTAKSRASGGREPLPYVMMIVRPSGVRLYPARQMIEPLEQITGYELLEEDQTLALPPPDPQAIEACRIAVERVLSERSNLLHQLAEREALDRLGSRYRFGAGGVRPSGSGLGAVPRSTGSLYDRGVGERTGRGLSGPGTGGPAPANGHPMGDGRSFGEWGPGGSEGQGGGTPARATSGSGTLGSPSGTVPGGIAGDGPPGALDSPLARGGAGPEGEAAHGGVGAGGESASGGAGTGGDEPPSSPSLEIPWYRSAQGRAALHRPLIRRWGLSDPRATIGFERDVTIEVHADRVVVGGSEAIPIPQSSKDEAFAERVLIAIDNKATAWGHPPENFYWVPSIRFVMHPGGEPHRERLDGPLKEWGLSTRVEPKR